MPPNDMHESNGLKICPGPTIYYDTICTVQMHMHSRLQRHAHINSNSFLDVRFATRHFDTHTKIVYRNLKFAIESHQTIEFIFVWLEKLFCFFILLLNACTLMVFFFYLQLFISSAVLLEIKMQNSRFIIQFRRFVLAPRGLIRFAIFPYQIWMWVVVVVVLFFFFAVQWNSQRARSFASEIHTLNSK